LLHILALQPEILIDLINQARLGQMNCPVALSIDVDSEEVREVAFDGDCQLCLILQVVNNFLNLTLIWPRKQAIISVEHIQCLPSVKHSLSTMDCLKPNLLMSFVTRY
jgi:hypothetical protein